jgi:peptide/nickel transport system permease protein
VSTPAATAPRLGGHVGAFGARVRRTPLYRGAVHTGTGRLGLVLCGLVLLLAFVAPYFSPYDPSALVGLPFAPPSSTHWLGTDNLGRDGFSRFLWGGRAMIVVAMLSTLLAYAAAIPIGMIAGFRRGAIDLGTVGVIDVLLAFPPIVFVLALLSATGPKLTFVILAIAIIHVPRIVRIVRIVTIEVATSEFVEAAVARGEPLRAILFREIMPNIWTPVLADFGLRLATSVILFASLSFLGVALQPPAADWGLMINENKLGLTVNPWLTIAPAVVIAVLTIGINLIADGAARSVGRSVQTVDD